MTKQLPKELQIGDISPDFSLESDAGQKTSLKDFTGKDGIFIDANIFTGSYSYRLKQIDYNGTFEYSDEIEVNATGPLTYNLEQNYPNPFNPTTTITYSIKEKVLVSLSVFDILGKEVKTLVNEEQEAGVYRLEFNASNLASGIYFYTLNAGEFLSTKKMILIR